MRTAWTVAWLLVIACPGPRLVGQTLATPGGLQPATFPGPHVAVSYNEYDDAATHQAAAASLESTSLGGGCGDCSSYGGCGNCCCCDEHMWLLPFVRRSDHCFDGFISPMTNPVFFEDPRNLTEVRFIFLNHKLPPALGSGDVQVYAPAMRARLTDRLSLIVTKGGYVVGGSDAPHGDGWADLSAGLKYTLISDPQQQRILSTGFTFELPVGSTNAFQGNGDGELNLFWTGGMQIGYDWHWISGGGIRLPMNTLQEAPVMYWSNHLDRRMIGNWYLLTEVNWFNYVKDGSSGFNGINGIDLYNFGGRNIAGNNIITGAFGTKWKPAPWTELGLAWELPLSANKDILEHRLTFDWIFRY